MAEEPKPIKRLVAKNYGCLKNVDMELTPLHALIGPNDSGKSTILRAVATLAQLASAAFRNVSTTSSEPFHHGIDFETDFEIACHFDDELGYRISKGNGFAEVLEQLILGDQGTTGKIGRYIAHGGVLGSNADTAEKKALAHRLSARVVRFDPDALRKDSTLIPDEREIVLTDERGHGLAGVYDAVVKRDDDAFREIKKRVQRLFPPVKKLRLRNVSQSTMALRIELNSGEEVDAELMSEGLLFYLAFAAIPHLAPTSVLLVEEPENGLHPARIRDIVGILREVSKKTQVIIATHSPLVVNELEPEEVSVVTRTVDEGTIVTPIKETSNFETRSKAYALGELWLSYCDGETEAPLINGQPRP